MLLKLLDRPIAYHRILAEIAGSVGGGVFLSQALYWAKRATLPDGWFYKTAEEWYEETYLTRREQETIRKRLVSINILKEEKRGVPAKLHYKINLEALESYAVTRCDTQGHADVNEDVQSSFDKSAKLGSTKTPNLIGAKRQTNTETTTETTAETTKDIYPAGFEEFWQAYPKRPGNPKAPAAAKYRYVREKIKIPHEALLQAAKAYAATREGEDPKFTAQAITWLNQRRWEDNYTSTVSEHKATKPQAPAAADADFDAIIANYPGVVSDRAAARKALAAELAKGVTVGEISEAVQKLALLVKQACNEGREMPVSIFETWIKFKWREMDAYEFYRGGMTMKLFVRFKKVK